MPFLIQIGFAEYGYIYFISFYLICHMKYLKRKNFLLFLLNDYGIFICFLVRLFLYSIMEILFILAYFNIYKFLVPFGNFKIYIYSLSFCFPFNEFMVIDILRRAEIYPNFTNYVQYKCNNYYETSLHTG